MQRAARNLTKTAWKRGSAMVEFALATTVLFMFIFGVIDFARAVYAYEYVDYSARLATRYAMVRGSTCSITSPTLSGCPATSGSVQTYIQGQNMPGIISNQITVTTTWPATGSNCPTAPAPTNSPGCPVRVVVQYPYQTLVPFLPSKSLTLQSTSQMIITQ